jgi:hypothetical protein
VAFVPAPEAGTAEQPAELRADFLRPFYVALLIKYASNAFVTAKALFVRPPSKTIVDALTAPRLIFWPTRLFSVVVVFFIVRWLIGRRRTDEMLVMFAVLIEAILRIGDQGPSFFNHYFLQALIGIMGMLAVRREIEGDRVREAWDPVAQLAVLVWGLAGLKKLLHGMYLNGEYLASNVSLPRQSPISWVMKTLLVHDGKSVVPTRCCSTGDLHVSAAVTLVIVALSVGIILAEISPVVVLAVTKNRALTGWIMLILTIIATGIANEADFGMVLVALALLIGEGFVFRRVSYATSLALAGAYIWQAFA